MNWKASVLCTGLMMSLAACMPANNNKNLKGQAQDQKVVISTQDKLNAQLLDQYMESIEDIFLNGDYAATEIAYNQLQKLLEIDPSNLKAQLYSKLMKPVILNKGVHRKMDHLVFLKGGTVGLFDHVRGAYGSDWHSDQTSFLRNAGRNDVWTTETQAQKHIDSLIAAYQDLFLFLKKTPTDGIKIRRKKLIDCDNDRALIFTGNQNYYIDGTGKTSGVQYLSRSEKEIRDLFNVVYIDGNSFTDNELEYLNRQIDKLTRELLRNQKKEGSLEEMEEVQKENKRLAEIIAAKKAQIAAYKELAPDKVFEVGSCNYETVTHPMNPLDNKMLQAAATGISMALAASNAYDLKNIVYLPLDSGFGHSGAESVAKMLRVDNNPMGDVLPEYQNLGKLRKDHRLDLFAQATTNIISGLQWLHENTDISCSASMINFYGEQICSKDGADKMHRLEPNQQQLILGRAETDYRMDYREADLVDHFASAISGPREQVLSVGGRYGNEYFTAIIDIRKIWENPVLDLKDYTGESFDQTGSALSVFDSTLNGVFTNGRLNDYLKFKSSVLMDKNYLYGQGRRN